MIGSDRILTKFSFQSEKNNKFKMLCL